jgi:hypothetical protein
MQRALVTRDGRIAGLLSMTDVARLLDQLANPLRSAA